MLFRGALQGGYNSDRPLPRKKKETVMGEEVYSDLEILATVNEDYLIRISKSDLNTLVTFCDELVIRHWDGDQPVVLEAYGDSAVRTAEDANTKNNLTRLPALADADLRKILG